jgi:hypothetical protein
MPLVLKIATPQRMRWCVLQLANKESVTAVQRAFRTQFHMEPASRVSMYAWYKKFEQDGCIWTTERRPTTIPAFVWVLSPWSTSRTLGWDSPNSRAISRHICTAAIKVSSLAGVHTVRWRPAFTSSAGAALPLPSRTYVYNTSTYFLRKKHTMGNLWVHFLSLCT